MATARIESGQVGIRTPQGGVPMVQIAPQQVDNIGYRAQAATANTMSQVLDRMSGVLFQEAGQMAQAQALSDVANTPLTLEQIEAAKHGDTSQLKLGGKFNMYDLAVRKARSFELAGRFEAEAKSEVVKLLADVENGDVKSDAVAQKLNVLTTGYSKSLASVDGDAALKFSSSMNMYSHTVMAEAYKQETRKRKEKQLLILGDDIQNTLKMAETSIAQGFWTDSTTGEQRSYDDFLIAYRKGIQDKAFEAGGLQMAQSVTADFDKAIKAAKINVLTKELMKEENLADSKTTYNNLVLGKLRPDETGVNTKEVVLRDLMMTDAESFQKVIANFSTMIDQRRKGIDNALYEDKRAGDDILRQMYSTTNGAQQQALFKQLKTMAVPPEMLSTARNFVMSDSATGVQRDDLKQFSVVAQRVALGLATADEVIASKGLTTGSKRTFLQQLTNPSDDLGFGVQQIGLSVGIRSDKLPAEMKSQEARQIAEETRNKLVQDLYTFARTADKNGLLPQPPEVRKKGIELANSAKTLMSSSFVKQADSDKLGAAIQIPELANVDLANDDAVKEAIAKATKRGAMPTSVNAAMVSVRSYRENMNNKVEDKKKEGQQ